MPVEDTYPLPWSKTVKGGLARFNAANGNGIAVADEGSKNDELWSFIVDHVNPVKVEDCQ